MAKVGDPVWEAIDKLQRRVEQLEAQVANARPLYDGYYAHGKVCEAGKTLADLRPYLTRDGDKYGPDGKPMADYVVATPLLH